jgi:hypothetical protein
MKYDIAISSEEINRDYEVIVCGGGPSGCAAATAAAREGSRVLLIESTGALGGMGTSGLVPSWTPVSDGERILYQGIAGKVFHLARKDIAHVPEDMLEWVAINPELLKRIYDLLVLDAGVTVLFNSMLCGVKLENEQISSIIVSNKSGLSAYCAGVYIDCTGDGDLSAWAGAPFEKGDPANGETQPASHCFTLSNVDSYAYAYHGQVSREGDESHIAHILKNGKFPLIKDRHCCNNFVGPGTVGFNAGHLWDVDSTDPFSVSNALIAGRKIAEEYHRALAEYYPRAFSNSFLSATGALMGIRESRRIMGDYILSIDDWLARRSFPDEVCRNNYPIDIHTAKDEIIADQQGKMSPMDRFKRYGKGESHGIPYRCLTPRGKTNLLTAGRSISTDRVVQASTRVMPVCLAVGEAAGIAASLAHSMKQIDVHGVDTGVLREKLRKAGAYLP